MKTLIPSDQPQPHLPHEPITAEEGGPNTRGPNTRGRKRISNERWGDKWRYISEVCVCVTLLCVPYKDVLEDFTLPKTQPSTQDFCAFVFKDDSWQMFVVGIEEGKSSVSLHLEFSEANRALIEGLWAANQDRNTPTATAGRAVKWCCDWWPQYLNVSAVCCVLVWLGLKKELWNRLGRYSGNKRIWWNLNSCITFGEEGFLELMWTLCIPNRTDEVKETRAQEILKSMKEKSAVGVTVV